MNVLCTWPVLERVMDALPGSIPIKRRYRVIVSLSLTCRSMYQRLRPNIAHARRHCLVRHCFDKWRRYKWMNSIPDWGLVFRHATDEWFALTTDRYALDSSNKRVPLTSLPPDTLRIDGPGFELVRARQRNLPVSVDLNEDGTVTMRVVLDICSDVIALKELCVNGQVANDRIDGCWLMSPDANEYPVELCNLHIPTYLFPYHRFHVKLRVRASQHDTIVIRAVAFDYDEETRARRLHLSAHELGMTSRQYLRDPYRFPISKQDSLFIDYGIPMVIRGSWSFA